MMATMIDRLAGTNKGIFSNKFWDSIWMRLVAKRATNLISCDNPSRPPAVGGLNSAQEHSWAWGRTVQKWGTQKWMVYIKKT